jgi:hypothetical protein
MPIVDFQLGGTLKFTIENARPICMVTLRYDGFTLTARGDDMAYTLPNDKMVAIKVSYVDSKGHPATVDGPVQWASSNTNVATVEVDSQDSQQAKIFPGDEVGQVQITAGADADLGVGVTTLITTMDLTVVGGQAVAGIIEPVGPPQPIAPHVEPR